MSFDFLIKQREQRLRGILRVSPCENIAPHDVNTCTACCAVAAERFLVSAVEADFQRQVAAKSAEMTPVQVSDAFVEVAKLHQYRYYRSHLSYERCRREQEKSLSQLASAYLRLGINVNEVKPNEICQ